MRLRNRLSSAGSLALLLFAQSALALPGAPMLPLADACPACALPEAAEVRPVILHPAFGRVIENQLPDWTELLAHTLRHYQETGVFDARMRDTQRRLAEWTQSPEVHHRLPRAEASRVHAEPLPAAVREALAPISGRASAVPQNFRRVFLFFDADDQAQLAWAAEAVRAAKASEVSREAAPGEIRLVLRQGKLSRAAEMLPGERLYFDQSGALSRRLRILALPARVSLTPSGIRTEEITLPAEPISVPAASRSPRTSNPPNTPNTTAAGPQQSDKPQKLPKHQESQKP